MANHSGFRRSPYRSTRKSRRFGTSLARTVRNASEAVVSEISDRVLSRARALGESCRQPVWLGSVGTELLVFAGEGRFLGVKASYESGDGVRLTRLPFTDIFYVHADWRYAPARSQTARLIRNADENGAVFFPYETGRQIAQDTLLGRRGPTLDGYGSASAYHTWWELRCLADRDVHLDLHWDGASEKPLATITVQFGPGYAHITEEASPEAETGYEAGIDPEEGPDATIRIDDLQAYLTGRMTDLEQSLGQRHFTDDGSTPS